MIYSTRHIANLFGVSRETVRTWATEFKEYLSAGAKPGSGRHRQFNEDDLTVFALVAQLKDAGMRYDDIHLALTNGQRAEPPDEATAVTTTFDERRLALLEKEIATLRQDLIEVRRDRDVKSGQVEMLERQIEQYKNEVKQLNREIGRLEAHDDD